MTIFQFSKDAETERISFLKKGLLSILSMSYILACEVRINNMFEEIIRVQYLKSKLDESRHERNLQ